MANSYIERAMGNKEQILLVKHRHWFALLGRILLEIVLIAALIAGVLIAMNYYPVAIYGFILVLVPLIGMIRDIMVWSNHKYVITNRRVMEATGVFSKKVLDSSLDMVNDIELSQSFLGRLFNYGDLTILTASELGVDRFDQIADPIKFKTTMLDAKENVEIDESDLQQKPEKDIPTLIDKLDDLRKRGIISEEEFQEKKADLLAKM